LVNVLTYTEDGQKVSVLTIVGRGMVGTLVGN
jgi:hypothetical protein